MNSSTQEHISLLKSLYKNTAPDVSFEIDEERYRFESERRILDICKTLWKYWPLTSGYTQARFGDDYALGVCEILSEDKFGSINLELAINFSLENWLKEQAPSFILELFKYECVQIGLFDVDEEADDYIKQQAPANVTETKILRLSYDPETFKKTLKFYLDQHSPSRFITTLTPEKYDTTLLVYKREGKIYCRNITAVA